MLTLRETRPIESYRVINEQESLNSIIPYRFEEEDYEHTYILEDFYCTNPFCDCQHVTLAFSQQDDPDNQITFLLNFDKTQGQLPNQKKYTKLQSEIIKNFVKNHPKELLVLFKQRYAEAKAFGEKDPMSYLVLESGRYVNYMECFPRNTENLNFSCEEEKYFAEDSYELDPRIDNRDVRLVFYPFELDDKNLKPIFSHTYFFDENKRAEEDGKLGAEESNILLGLTQTVPDLFEKFKKRYKQAKLLGEDLVKAGPKTPKFEGKIKPNDPCPCGSGKKYKKCCANNKLN